LGLQNPTGRAALMLLAVAVLGGFARPEDEAFAEFLFEKGNKALRSRDYEEAATQFERAVEQKSPYPEAAFALGEVLERLGHLRDAMAAYRRCESEVAAAESPSRAWQGLAHKAEAALSRLKRRFAELNRLDDRFVRDCLALARKHKDTRPGIARQALEAARRIDPESMEVRALLEDLPGPPPEGTSVEEGAAPAEVPGAPELKGTPLFPLDQLDDWDPGAKLVWSIENGTVTADSRDGTGHLNWYDAKRFTGDYTVRVRMRMLRETSARRYFGMMIGGDGKGNWWAIVINSSDELMLDRVVDDQREEIRTVILPGFDPKAWNTLEAQTQRGTIYVRMNGKEVCQATIGGRSAFDGKVALFVQELTIEFQRLEVEE